MIRLIHGSIFDSKCDLVVIPCNNLGGVTHAMSQSIEVNYLPNHNKKMSIGEVAYYNASKQFANASVVAYAASVNIADNSSTDNTLILIVKSISDYCLENALHIVNIPLIGTGAGGIPSDVSYSIIKSCFENISSIQVNVYALSSVAYQLLAENELSIKNIDIEIIPPRVFISYTGTDPKNKEWVKDFACKLRENGVDARIDVFHLKPGYDLPQWMTNEIVIANKVIIICDKHYANKADNRKGGVGWETMIIQGDMLMNMESGKYVFIVVDEDFDHCIPIYAKSKYILSWSDHKVSEEEFQKLLFCIYECDIIPPVQKPPKAIIDTIPKDSAYIKRQEKLNFKR